VRVVHISSHDTFGGAARAALRLHKGLQGAGNDSTMLVHEKLSDDHSVLGPVSNIAKGIAHFRTSIDHIPKLFYPNRKPTVFHFQWLPDYLIRKLKALKPQIVHLHWICRGFVNIRTLARIEQPLVWTLHDMWPFTGGCHFVGKCERYIQVCGKCPQLASNRKRDLSWWTWRRKAKQWHDLNLNLAAPSRWMKRCAQQSSLLNTAPIDVIPYGINNARLSPRDRAAARRLLGLSRGKKLILFGAVNATSDKRKGFDFLLPALRQIAASETGNQTECVVFGASKPSAPPDFGLETTYLGPLHDELSLSLVYRACDVFVVPSHEDNLPNTIMEALACGIPCVAFNVGGVPEMIEHKISGYLADPFDTDALAKGIAWILEKEPRWRILSAAARKKAEDEYDIKTVTKSYIDLYQSVLGDRKF